MEIADALEAWFRAGAADGFTIMPPFFPTPFERFVEGLLSILREHLGLPRPAGRQTG